MAISEVASKRVTGTPVVLGNTMDLVIPSGVTSGDLLIAGGSWFLTGTTTLDLTLANTVGTSTAWTVLGAESPTDNWEWIAYAVATSTGACTIRVTTAGSPGYISGAADVFTGQHATPFSVDGGAASGAGANPTKNITTATANELIIGVVSHGDSSADTITEGTNFTTIGEEENGLTNATFNLEFRIVTTAQAYAVPWTLAAHNWGMYCVSFKEAAGAGRTTKNTRSAPLGMEAGMGWRMGL